MKCLIICSGGLDSVSMALTHINDDVTFLTFNYGQKATKESDVVEWLAKKYNKEFIKADISSLSWIFGKDNQLTNDNVEVEGNYKPSIVVPLRNGVFIQLALCYAYSNDFDRIVLGSHLDDCVISPETGDFSFPDCTAEYFKAMEFAAIRGVFRAQKPVYIESASRNDWYKTDLIKKAYEIDKEALFKSWSCYKNGDKQCGVCDSCRNRREAFAHAFIDDETEYENN